MIDSLTKKQKISFGLGMALPILLLPSTHQNEKVIFTDVLAITWLVYSILYQDIPVMILCITILIYNLDK
jgi:hypothetical protein